MSESGQAFERDKVIKIISSVITKVGAQELISRETLYKELHDLHDIIESARKEIGYAAPGDIKDTYIPTATDELDEVVSETAKATGEIMDCCDIVQTAMASFSGPEADKINAAVMRIYEACSFQDITGQRVRKVIKTLREIDTKVDALLRIMGIKSSGKQMEKKISVEDEKSLLNGPQLPGSGGVSQADIDKLLEEFG